MTRVAIIATSPWSVALPSTDPLRCRVDDPSGDESARSSTVNTPRAAAIPLIACASWTARARPRPPIRAPSQAAATYTPSTGSPS